MEDERYSNSKCKRLGHFFTFHLEKAGWWICMRCNFEEVIPEGATM